MSAPERDRLARRPRGPRTARVKSSRRRGAVGSLVGVSALDRDLPSSDLTLVGASLPAAPLTPARSSADCVVRRVLRLPEDAPRATRADAQKAFQTSIAVAAVRCVLMYLVFPFVLPAVGVAQGVGPAIGLVINVAAMACIVLSMRRFWRADHPKRWWYGALGGTVFVLLAVLSVGDAVAAF